MAFTLDNANSTDSQSAALRMNADAVQPVGQRIDLTGFHCVE
jgi:hypothetical protein